MSTVPASGVAGNTSAPAPWAVQVTSDNAVVGPGGELVATVYPHPAGTGRGLPRPAAEPVANARLIASAPDLRDALATLLRAFQPANGFAYTSNERDAAENAAAVLWAAG